MPIFAVHLREVRQLCSLIDARDAATAIRLTRSAWSKLGQSAPLPFEVRTAQLAKPALAAHLAPFAIRKPASRGAPDNSRGRAGE